MAMMDPKLIRVTMARKGIAPMHLLPWWSPDTESDVHPLDDAETQAEVKGFMAWLWGYCLEAEQPLIGSPTDQPDDRHNRQRRVV